MKSCFRFILLASVTLACASSPKIQLRGEDPQIEANFDSMIVKHALDGILHDVKRRNSSPDKQSVVVVSAEFEHYPGAVLYATNVGKARFYRAWQAEGSLSIIIERIPLKMTYEDFFDLVEKAMNAKQYQSVKDSRSYYSSISFYTSTPGVNGEVKTKVNSAPISEGAVLELMKIIDKDYSKAE